MELTRLKLTSLLNHSPAAAFFPVSVIYLDSSCFRARTFLFIFVSKAHIHCYKKNYNGLDSAGKHSCLSLTHLEEDIIDVDNYFCIHCHLNSMLHLNVLLAHHHPELGEGLVAFLFFHLLLCY